MSKETDFLLGRAFSLVTQARQYLINKVDNDGVALIEDEYQELKRGVEKNFYGEKA